MAATATCEDGTGTRDYLQAKNCVGARGSCPESAQWTCLKDDPDTLGNDTSQVVSCGATEACDLASSSCCVASYGKDDKGNDQTYCEPGHSCAQGETSIPCDGAEDCGGGEVCCIRVMITIFQQTGTAHGQCEPTADCEFQYDLVSGQLELRVCHTDADCEDGQTCKERGDFTWWGSCQ